ncbi:MAG: hypothetical protein CMP47_06560 [Rickettsiales bacterium]|nr:hypothetical protein [Rickettsiales bacterium]
MVISREKTVKIISGFIFLLLFPCFYFYHQTLASGHIPPFLGGFLSPVSLLAIIVYLFFLKFIISTFSYSMFACLFFALSLYLCFMAFASFSLDGSEQMLAALTQLLNTVLLWVSLFLVGTYIDLDEVIFKRLLLISSLIMLVTLLIHVITSGSFIYYAAQLHSSKDTVVSYQGFARSAQVMAFALVSIYSSTRAQLIICLLSTFALFVLAARSEFAAFVLCIIIFFVSRSLIDKSKLLVTLVILLLGFSVAVTYFDVLSTSRQLNILELSHDTSWQARNQMLIDAWERIADAPLTGDFGGHLQSGDAGAYAHNIISLWDSFGLIPFLIYISFILTACIQSFLIIIKQLKLSAIHIFYFLMSWNSLILLLVAKSYFWIIPAMVFGLYVNINNKKLVSK